MKILNIVETAYRATLEEQDDTSSGSRARSRTPGADLTVLLRGNAVNYVVTQSCPTVTIGAMTIGHPARPNDDLAKLEAKGAKVFVVQEDLDERGIDKQRCVAAAERDPAGRHRRATGAARPDLALVNGRPTSGTAAGRGGLDGGASGAPEQAADGPDHGEADREPQAPDPTHGLMASVAAANIAYRAVRNRGTIGGSLAHADPGRRLAERAARCLDALHRLQVAAGRAGSPHREVPDRRVRDGAHADELLVAIRIPKRSRRARYGYWKFCRKAGEFAQAIGAALHDPERNETRAVIGAIGGAPHLISAAHHWNRRGSRSAATPAWRRCL